eukprot:2748452-Prymnesium_polylepis.1
MPWTTITTDVSSDRLGKKLRDACADRSGPIVSSLEEVKRLLADGADVNDANRNGKRAVHFAAQLRSDTEVLALLVAATADINVATHRGHTPLIYASGRCRNEVVEFLLDHGADAATWTVNGDCAVSMGRNKGLRPDVFARLEANQRASTSPRDFRGDERAILAQQEHARTCSCCQRRLQAQYGIPPPLEAAAAELAAELGAAASESSEALSAALLQAASSEAPLRRAIEFSLSMNAGAEEATAKEEGGEVAEEGAEAAEAAADENDEVEEAEEAVFAEEVIGVAVSADALLRAARDEALGRCLGKGARGRARRPVRMVAGAVFAAIQAPGVVDALAASGAELSALVEAADAHIAAEIVRLWPAAQRDDAVCQQVWRRMVSDKSGWTDSFCDNTPKRSGGPRAAQWSRALRWAAAVGFDGWEACVDEVLDSAHRWTIIVFERGRARGVTARCNVADLCRCSPLHSTGAIGPLLGLLRQDDNKPTATEKRKAAKNELPPALHARLVELYGASNGERDDADNTTATGGGGAPRSGRGGSARAAAARKAEQRELMELPNARLA